jgi:putative tricarboxylic transport membrane protein
VKIDNTELWSGIFALGLSAFVIWSGYDLGLGSVNDPGSGYIMFYAGFLMLLFAVIILYGAVRDGGPTLFSLWRNVLWTKPLLVIALLVAFGLLFETLGFLISAPLLLLALLRVIDPVPWRTAIPIAIIVPVVCWYMLVKQLLIQLPSGVFGIG